MPFLSQVELSTEDKIHFVAIGDWGTGLGHQKEVATALGEFCFHNRLLFFAIFCYCYLLFVKLKPNGNAV